MSLSINWYFIFSLPAFKDIFISIFWNPCNRLGLQSSIILAKNSFLRWHLNLSVVWFTKSQFNSCYRCIPFNFIFLCNTIYKILYSAKKSFHHAITLRIIGRRKCLSYIPFSQQCWKYVAYETSSTVWMYLSRCTVDMQPFFNFL